MTIAIISFIAGVTVGFLACAMIVAGQQGETDQP